MAQPLIRLICLWLLCVFSSSNLMAQPDTLVIDQGIQSISLPAYFELLVDSQRQFTLQDVQGMDTWQPIEEVTMPLPLDVRLWGRMHVSNRMDSTQQGLLELGATDSSIVYLIDSRGTRSAQTGLRVPTDKRNLPFGWNGGIQLDFYGGEITTVYVRMEERESRGPYLEPRLQPYAPAMISLYDNTLGPGMMVSWFLGGIMFILLYNLVVAASVRSLAYLYYSLYLLCICITLYFAATASLFPIFSPFLEREDQWVQTIFLGAATLFYLLFGRKFLHTAVVTPKWDYVLKTLIGIRLLIIGALLGAYVISLELVEFMSTVSVIWLAGEALIIMIYSVRLAKLKSRIAWFFIAGSALVFIGGFMPVWLTSIFGILANNALFLLISLSIEILVFSLGLGYKMRQQQQEKLAAEQALNEELQKINSAFGRFVPHAFLESLGHQSVLDVQLGDQVEKEVTVLFSDIRSYTSLAEGMTPQENFNFLNSYLGRMGPIIQENQGFVNQYYGDGIMALFLQRPSDALQAAITMQQALRVYNEERMAKGRRPLQIGIGIHTGSLMMGIIGDTLRLEAGVVSDTVNTAARMEGLTKHFGVNLLLSDATYQRLNTPDAFDLRLLGKVIVKGRKQPLPVYQVYDGESTERREALGALHHPFEVALQCYLQADFAQALRQFEALHAKYPDDAPVARYMELSRLHLTDGVPENWDGVEVMTAK